jgi:putative tricarboxylic transport membrane protein
MFSKLFAKPGAREDISLGLIVLAFSVAIYIRALSLPPPQFDPLGAAAIPKLIAVILAIISIFILINVFLRKPSDPLDVSADSVEAAPLRPGIAAASILILMAYAGAMSYGILGFRAATILFVILLGGVMSRFRLKTMFILTICALVIGFGFAWIFSEILYIDLPQTGILESLLDAR